MHARQVARQAEVGAHDADGLLEVAYEDLVRALREASPRPAFARRADSRAGAQAQRAGFALASRHTLRAMWRERRLGRLTDRAMQAPEPETVDA